MQHNRLLLLIALILLPGEFLLAQVSTFQNTPGGRAICAWNQVTLRSGPGKDAPYVTGVFFGETVEKTGEEAYAQAEKRSYIKVRTSEGVVGWVHEFLFVNGIGMAAVTEPGRIYKRPRTVSTITDQSFLPGELVVLVADNNGWIHLIGREKKKEGWIEDPGKITNNPRDLEIASLLYDAQQKKPQERQEALGKLYAEAQQSRSPLAQSIEMVMRGTTYEPPLVDARSQNTSSMSAFNDFPANSSDSRPNTRTSEPAYSSGYVSPAPTSSQTRTYANPETRTGNRVSGTAARQPSGMTPGSGYVEESGQVTVISSLSREPDIFYAYHKTLPVGSVVYVDIPGNPGFVELRVTGNLPANSPYVLGLPVACYDALLGPTRQREISLSYQR